MEQVIAQEVTGLWKLNKPVILKGRLGLVSVVSTEDLYVVSVLVREKAGDKVT